ncbi:MAG: thiamine phosphate synthase, partial [Candidatus Sumerlaeia bacterium]|nr:thiamine phosphate synthase [Candidatus Sumerlaeia bacterium]
MITDIQMAGGRSYTEIVLQALRGGARIIQLRDKTTPLEELIKIGRTLKNLIAEYDALFIVNDNPYLAKEVDADGVHLG